MNKTCYGKVSKADWYSPKRSRVCIDTFAEQLKLGTVTSTAIGLDICNLNKKTNELCMVLQAAQGKVFEANCIFAGVCAPQMFVYSPGMYSSTNQDFVRGTVSSFYEMFKQVSIRRSADNADEDAFRAFVFNQTGSASDGQDMVRVFYLHLSMVSLLLDPSFYVGVARAGVPHGQHGVGPQGAQPGHEAGLRFSADGRAQEGIVHGQDRGGHDRAGHVHHPADNHMPLQDVHTLTGRVRHGSDRGGAGVLVQQAHHHHGAVHQEACRHALQPDILLWSPWVCHEDYPLLVLQDPANFDPSLERDRYVAQA
jgi:hypothetical protein